jgi:hypothetical protein
VLSGWRIMTAGKAGVILKGVRRRTLPSGLASARGPGG